jgi:hypothetical protein
MRIRHRNVELRRKSQVSSTHHTSYSSSSFSGAAKNLSQSQNMSDTKMGEK